MPTRTGRLSAHLLVVLVYVALAVIMHWPLVMHLDTHVAGPWLSDNFEALWHLDRAASAIYDRPTGLLFDPHVYYPKGWHLASAALSPWFAASVAPLTHLVGPVASLNLTYLGLLVVAATGAYSMAYHQTGNRSAALVAGLIYMTAPVLTLRLRGHVHLLAGAAVLPYPFVFSALSLESRTRRQRLFLAALSGLALSLCTLLHWYFFFIATLPLVVFVLLYGLQRRSCLTALKLLCVSGVVVLALISPFALVTMQARQAMQGDTAEFPLAASDPFSLSPDLLIAPNRFHPVWGPWAARVFPLTGEQDVSSLGYAATLLTLVGLVRSSDSRKWTLLVVAGCALVLAMGTTLHWRGVRVEIPSIEPLASLLSRDAVGAIAGTNRMPVPLPGLLLARFVPFYGAMRVWGRFSIPLIFMISSLAAIGLASMAKTGMRGWMLAGLFGLVVMAEGWVTPYISPYSGVVLFTDVSVNRRPQLEAWLMRLPEDTAIIEYPRPELDVLAMYSQSFHDRNIVNGYMSMPPLHLRANESSLGHVPGDATVALLREWQVDYVVYSEQDGAQMELAAIRAIAGLRPLATYDEGFPGYVRTHVFAVDRGDE
jgi:hypothetical protein